MSCPDRGLNSKSCSPNCLDLAVQGTACGPTPASKHLSSAVLSPVSWETLCTALGMTPSGFPSSWLQGCSLDWVNPAPVSDLGTAQHACTALASVESLCVTLCVLLFLAAIIWCFCLHSFRLSVFACVCACLFILFVCVCWRHHILDKRQNNRHGRTPLQQQPENCVFCCRLCTHSEQTLYCRLCAQSSAYQS